MTSQVENLSRAYTIIIDCLGDRIQDIHFEEVLARIRVVLKDSTAIYILYNNHGKYSYNCIFSNSKYDRVRFDNYDDRWAVSSKPHHFHPRFSKQAISSNMIGEPEIDLPEFCKLVINSSLRNPKLRF